MEADPLTDYLERTFAEAYRKEIDAEENVWRSLPFFAATLALELAALSPVRDWVPGTQGPVLGWAEALLGVAGLFTVVALGALAMSVRPANFVRVAPEIGLLEFGQVGVDATAGVAGGAGNEALDRTLARVRRNLARQYAAGVANNRGVIENRMKWRARAGMATLGSVLVVLALVALVVISNIHAHG